MFSGIIQEKVPLKNLRWTEDGEACAFKIESKHAQRKSWKLGDSLALDGACLTIVEVEHSSASSQISFDVSKETLAKTHWAQSIAAKHARMNALHLEPALRLGDALGGHLVSGHVEGLAVLESRKVDAKYLELCFSVPRGEEISPFLISKGSVALDGTSLTLNQVWDARDAVGGKTFFKVYLIPYTVEQCHFALLREGDYVNIESDMMARHFCRYNDVVGKQNYELGKS